jgi:hypothetical protein
MLIVGIALALATAVETPASASSEERVAEMIGIYGDICLRAFPDRKAATQAVGEHGGTDHEAFNIGHNHYDFWSIKGRTGDFPLQINTFPRACSLSAEMPDVPDMGVYRDTIERFETGKDFVKGPTSEYTINHVRELTSLDMWNQQDKRVTEGLGITLAMPDEIARADGKRATVFMNHHFLSLPRNMPAR